MSVTVVTAVERRPIAPPIFTNLWMHKEDKFVSGSIRSCAPCPAVWVLLDDPHAQIGRQWQYYLRAINANMTLGNVYLILDDHLAWANRTGFPNLDNPGLRQDWFFNRNTDTTKYKPPQYDKVRTGSRNVVFGTPEYSLAQAVKAVLDVTRTILQRSLIGGKRQAFLAAATAVNVLRVETFDSRKNPPLKPGKSYPSRIQDVNPDDYLYHPKNLADRGRFIVANIVNKAGEVVQFPRGALYPWFEDGRTIGTFLPQMSNHAYGPVRPPLAEFVQVTTVPSPYRSA